MGQRIEFMQQFNYYVVLVVLIVYGLINYLKLSFFLVQIRIGALSLWHSNDINISLYFYYYIDKYLTHENFRSQFNALHLANLQS